jgi:drug/metabolite transporter (DMT)-like permease
VAQVLWAMAPYHNDAAVVGFGIRLSFLFSLIFGLLWLPAERHLARIPLFWLGVLVSIGGVILMYGASLRVGGATSATGIGILLVTAVFWGLYTVTVKVFMSPYPVRLSFGAISGYTAAGLMVLAVFKGDGARLAALEPGIFGMIALSAFVGIAASHVLLYRSIVVLGAITSSGALLLAPFVTWLGAATWLGEAFTAWQMSGGLILLLGTFLLIRARFLLDLPGKREWTPARSSA